MRQDVLYTTTAVVVALLCAGVAAAETYTPTCGVPADRFDDQGERFAVLASVNEYAPGSTRSDLAGTGNDMERLCRVLVDRYGFEETDILRLHGPTASKAGLLGGLDELAKRSQAGRMLVFGYAGHGSFTADDQTDEEPDDRDETLCPWDAQTAGDLRDDQVHDKLGMILDGGAHLVTIFDSCHSGTVSRGDPRSPLGADGATSRKADPHPNPELIESVATGRGDGGDVVGGLARHERMVLIAAAADHQEAKERWVAMPDGTQVKHGAFSHALLSVLETARLGAPWSEIVDRAGRDLSRQRGRQTPQFAGNLRLQAFGTREVTLDPHFSVTSVETDGDVIKVDGGQAHGVQEGALLAVYARGTKRLRGEEGLVGIYKVTRATATKVTASRQPDLADDEAGATARPMALVDCPVALLVPGDAFEQQRVFIDPASLPSEWAEQIRGRVDFLPLIDAAPEGATPRPSDFVVYQESAPRGCVVVEGGPSFWPGPAEDEEACAIYERVNADPEEWGWVPQEPRHVWDALGRFAAWERIRNIRNDDPEFRGEDLVAVSITGRLEDGSPDPDWTARSEAETGDMIVGIDDHLVINYRKIGGETLFVSTLYLSNDGAIYWRDAEYGSPLHGEVDLKAPHEALDFAPPCGTDHVKLFITDRKRFDASPFVQGAPALAQGRDGDGSDDLAWWVGPMLLGSRALKPKPRASYGLRWTTIDLPLKITGCPERAPAASAPASD